MVRFVHTADLQLGKPFAYLDVERAALLGEARLQALRKLLEKAGESSADFVVVAGDFYDANTIDHAWVVKANDLVRHAGVPVYVIPGNHDHGGGESIFATNRMRSTQPDNLHVLLTDEPVLCVGERAVILPAPLLRRHERRDVTEHMTSELGRDLVPSAVRIGLAHGGVTEFGLGEDAMNLIDSGVVERAELDYLALGDWHGLKQVTDRVWYSGTPEPDRFKDNEPGHALIVEIEHQGAQPEVTPFPTARYRWLRRNQSFRGSDDIADFEAFLDGLDPMSDCLVRLEYDGALTLSENQRLEAALEQARHGLVDLRERGAGVVAMPSDEELQSLQLDGYVGKAVGDLRLQSKSVGTEHESEGGRLAAAALNLLYRIRETAQQ